MEREGGEGERRDKNREKTNRKECERRRKKWEIGRMGE